MKKNANHHALLAQLQNSNITLAHDAYTLFLSSIVQAYGLHADKLSFRKTLESILPSRFVYQSFLATIAVYIDSKKALAYFREKLPTLPPTVVVLDDAINIVANSYAEEYGKSLSLMLRRPSIDTFSDFRELAYTLVYGIHSWKTGKLCLGSPEGLAKPSNERFLEVGEVYKEKLQYLHGHDGVFFGFIFRDVKNGYLSPEDFEQYFKG